jgi:hypothetical protein
MNITTSLNPALGGVRLASKAQVGSSEASSVPSDSVTLGSSEPSLRDFVSYVSRGSLTGVGCGLALTALTLPLFPLNQVVNAWLPVFTGVGAVGGFVAGYCAYSDSRFHWTKAELAYYRGSTGA